MAELPGFAEALSTVLTLAAGFAAPTLTETTELAAAYERVLAEPLLADRDQPPFDRSTRDGFAVQAAHAGERRIVGSLRAGEAWTGAALGAEDAIEIMTGAPLPPGADSVAMVEHVQVRTTSTNVKVLQLAEGRTLHSGENVVPRGAEARAGAQLLPAGVRLHAAEIALAASVGAGEVRAYARPVVAIVSTGDELVAVTEKPGPSQIRNSNASGLAALVRANGGEALVLPPARDSVDSIADAVAQARGAAMLLLSGGVSAGRFDFVEEALLRHGAEFLFTGVRMQPGKPVVFGRIPGAGAGGAVQWIFGLPGNPVSTQVTATLFAMPLLRALGGERDAAPHFAQATLTEALHVRPGTTKFLPARMESSFAGATVRHTGWQGSGDLHANARANCYLVLGEGRDGAVAGESVAVLLR